MSKRGLIERCLDVEHDCFRLVVLASYRAKELASRVVPMAEKSRSKDVILALQEISTHQLDLSSVQDRLVESLQNYAFLSERSHENSDEPSEDTL